MEQTFKHITESEKLLLENAKILMDMNRELNPALTGSLMLAARGIERRREAADIDIICEYLCEKEEGLPNVPKTWKMSEMNGSRSDVEAIQFINQITGIKVDFMASDEDTEVVDGVRLGSVDMMIEAKERYAKNDLSDASRGKHQLDLILLWNYKAQN